MSDVSQVDPEFETPVNPYSLLDAVNRSSDMAHTGWLIFLGVMAYLMIAVAGVTHQDLLLEKPVQLPIFGIEIPQLQFFQFAPILLVLFHLGIVSQLVLLSRKTLEFDFAVQQLESTVKRTHPLRLELHNFFFVQAIAGPHRSWVLSVFLHGMSWLTLVIIPVLLLLFIQIKFLPYHDVTTTWVHRLALVVDIVMLLLIGVFLIRAEPSFFSAVFRTIRHHPLGFLSTTSVFTLVTMFSFFVATVPGEPLDRLVQRARAAEASASAGGEFPIAIGFVIPFLEARPDGSLFGLFHRNLIVTDTDLVRSDSMRVGETSINLRDRDLRFARLDRSDLQSADLTGANLDGASLVGTDLRGIRLQCTDVTLLILTDDREAARCASARNADFSRANLTGGRFVGVDLRGSKLEEANLSDATMTYSLLAGANFSSAKLHRADLTGGVKAQGANFLIASLMGADLTGAQLQFADLSSASLQGAILAHAQLQTAVLRDADLEGADLQRARLHGADLTGANLRAADLRWSGIWMTAPPTRGAVEIGDLSLAAMEPPTDAEKRSLTNTINAMGDERVRGMVRDGLRPLLDVQRSEAWRDSDQALIWRELRRLQQFAVDDQAYRAGLTGYLAQLACRRRWLDGSVATGVARRARGQNFRGAVAEIYSAISNGSCMPGQSVRSDLLLDLSVLSERDP